MQGTTTYFVLVDYNTTYKTKPNTKPTRTIYSGLRNFSFPNCYMCFYMIFCLFAKMVQLNWSSIVKVLSNISCFKVWTGRVTNLSQSESRICCHSPIKNQEAVVSLIPSWSSCQYQFNIAPMSHEPLVSPA